MNPPIDSAPFLLPQDLRRKAARLVAAKCTLAARVDSFHESTEGKVRHSRHLCGSVSSTRLVIVQVITEFTSISLGRLAP